MSTDLHAYRRRPAELEREASLLQLVPSGGSVLDVGIRDGHYTRLLRGRSRHVVGLDYVPPPRLDAISTVQGDVRRLPFQSESFDSVLCAEVLEHLPDVQTAAAELVRVTRQTLVVGVPYRQDLRIDQLKCAGCGALSGAWGHVNSFDEAKLVALCAPLKPQRVLKVGRNEGPTNAVAEWLIAKGGAAGLPMMMNRTARPVVRRSVIPAWRDVPVVDVLTLITIPTTAVSLVLRPRPLLSRRPRQARGHGDRVSRTCLSSLRSSVPE